MVDRVEQFAEELRLARTASLVVSAGSGASSSELKSQSPDALGRSRSRA